MATKDTFRTPDRTQPKWRYIIQDDEGMVWGTNDAGLAKDCPYSVIDTLKGTDYDTGESIEEWDPDAEEEEEEDEE